MCAVVTTVLVCEVLYLFHEDHILFGDFFSLELQSSYIRNNTAHKHKGNGLESIYSDASEHTLT